MCTTGLAPLLALHAPQYHPWHGLLDSSTTSLIHAPIALGMSHVLCTRAGAPAHLQQRAHLPGHPV